MTRLLVGEGFALEVAGTAEPVLEVALASGPFDLVIADAGAGSVMALSAAIRAISDDLLLLAGRIEADVVAAISAGADGYVLRTTVPRVLAARVRALIRRGAGEPGRHGVRLDVLSIGTVAITTSAAGAVDDEQTLVLDPDSYALLRVLLRRPGVVVSRTELLAEIGLAPNSGPALDPAVRRLRERLERRFPQRRIVAVRGVGYRYDADLTSVPCLA